MRKMIRRVMDSIFLVILFAVILSGCSKKDEPVAVLPEEAEEFYDDEEFEEYEDDEDYEDYEYYEEGPEEITEGEAVDLSKADTSGNEGDEGEGVTIADGEYVTDEEYTGELSADGKTMTITTALWEFVNSPKPSYPKQTYVITVADSCKCIEVQEETKTSSFFDKMDLINEFLEGQSGLPITLKLKNNELVEILFSS